jgi:hypothetical protein
VRADQPIADALRRGAEQIAAVAGVVAEAAVDQRVDLALDQLVQSRRLRHAQTDPRLRRAETGRRQAAQVETGMQADGQQRDRAGRLESRRRIGDAAEAGGNGRQVLLAGRRQDELLVQALEQRHAQALLKRLDLLADCPGCNVQLLRGELEAEMAGRGLEGAQRVERRQRIGHGALSRRFRPALQ